MKQYWKTGLAMLLICLMAAGCTQQEQKQEKTSIRIGVSLYRGDDTFINNLRLVMEEKAKEYEQENGIKVTLDIQDAKGSQNTQNNQVERFISLGCDAICVNPVDRTDASVMIDRAMTAGVPMVFFNRQPVEEDMNRWERLYYVGADAKESAVLQGSILVDAYRENPGSIDLNGDGVVSYVLLEGESSHQDSLIRTEWSIQTLKDGDVPIEKITGGIANWERSQASALMEQWLEAHPGNIELVISNNDDMALGAIDALDRTGAWKMNLVGIDATIPGLEAVRAGKMLGTVESDKQLYAGTVFQIAVANAMGREIPEEIELENGKYYWCPQRIVTKNSIK